MNIKDDWALIFMLGWVTGVIWSIAVIKFIGYLKQNGL